MPTPTYDLIASNVLTSSASSVTFSSIPATYRDLVVVVTATTASGSFFGMRLNGATTNYSQVYATGTGSSTISNAFGNTFLYLTYANFSLKNNSVIQIMDYSATNKHKTILIRSNDSAVETAMSASRYASTSAISSIEFMNSTYASGSTFYLYGIVS